MADPIAVALQELAGLHLYRRNAFRITGLRTDADRPAVRHQRQKLATLLKVGGDTGLDADPQEIAAAFDLVLGDPRRRLVHEVLWLWDQPDTPCTCPPAVHRAHDDAVRAHSAAIDAETSSTWPSPLDRRRLDTLWTRAGDAWTRQTRRAVFWNHLRERIAALDDRQLDESALDTLREELPVTLVRPLVQLIAAGGGRQAELSTIAHAWPGASIFVDDQLEKTAEPLYEELRTDLDRIAERLTGGGTPHEAEKQLRARALPTLKRLEELVPSGRHRKTARMSNDVATAINNCAARLIDSTGAAAEKSAGGWLRKARRLANDPQTIATIDKNAATLAEIVRASRTPVPYRTADPDLERVLALLRSRPGVPPSVEDLMAALGGLEPHRPPVVPSYRLPVEQVDRPRSTAVRTLVTVVVCALLAYGVYWAVSSCLPSGGGNAATTVTVAAATIATNAPVGTCIAGDRNWQPRARALTSVPCRNSHWGEVLGYVPLEASAVFPGPVLLSQKTIYGCSYLLVARGLATGEYITEGAYTGAADWTKGKPYASCLLRRGDGKVLPPRALVDPGRTITSDVVMNLGMMSLDLADNPPPGSCIATRTSYDDNDGRADFVACALPHWGEIIGYPVLYGPGQAWPGDAAVSAAATAACDALFRKRGPGTAYGYVLTWPAREFWTDGPNTLKYAVCVVKRTDDQLTSGALK